jgi:hypothetical protein
MLASVSLLFDVEVGLLPKEEKLAVNIPLSCTRMRHKCVMKQKGTTIPVEIDTSVQVMQ